MKFSFIFFFILLISCSDSDIKSVDELWKSGIDNRAKNDLRLSITSFRSIVQNYPKSDISPKAQFQIADIYLNDVKDYTFAIDEFEFLIKTYPGAELAKKSAFMVAYIYSNYLEEFSLAIVKYELFLEQYPDDELIPSVEFELEGLRKHQQTIDSLNNL